MSGIDVNHLRVLVVEDNVHFRTLIRTILEALGVESLEEARDGSEVIEVLKASRPISPSSIGKWTASTV
jgi:CheY-like chemotaxis protein